MDHTEPDAERQRLQQQMADAHRQFEQAQADLRHVMANDALRSRALERLQAAADRRDRVEHALKMYETQRDQARRDTSAPRPTDASADTGITQRHNNSPEQDADLERKERFYRSRPEGRR